MLLDDGKEALCGQGTAGAFPTCEVHGAGATPQRAENSATKLCHQAPYSRAMAFKVSLKKKEKAFFQSRNIAL